MYDIARLYKITLLYYSIDNRKVCIIKWIMYGKLCTNNCIKLQVHRSILFDSK